MPIVTATKVTKESRTLKSKKENKTMKTLTTIFSVSICVVMFLSSAVFAAPTPATTSLQITPNPATLSGDINPDVTFNTTTGTPTYSGTPVTAGNMQVQWASDGVGNPVPSTYIGAITWIGFGAPKTPDSNGETSWPVDIDPLFTAGTVVGIRAHFANASSGYATHDSGIIDLVVINSCSGGLTIAADLVEGEGSPAPGYGGCWTFRITLTNCTGNNLTGVKVQGGTNGWTSFSDYDESTGGVNIKANKKNEVLTWILDIADGATETLEVTVCGSIKPSTPDGTVLFLSGAWSAVYDDDADPITPTVKTEYTGRVSITVTEPIL